MIKVYVILTIFRNYLHRIAFESTFWYQNLISAVWKAHFLVKRIWTGIDGYTSNLCSSTKDTQFWRFSRENHDEGRSRDYSDNISNWSLMIAMRYGKAESKDLQFFLRSLKLFPKQRRLQCGVRICQKEDVLLKLMLLFDGWGSISPKVIWEITGVDGCPDNP